MAEYQPEQPGTRTSGPSKDPCWPAARCQGLLRDLSSGIDRRRGPENEGPLICSWLYGALARFLDETDVEGPLQSTSGTSPPSISSKSSRKSASGEQPMSERYSRHDRSLKATALRLLPRLAQKEHQTSRKDIAIVLTEMYADLELLLSTHAAAGTGMRAVVRAHGLAKIADAITDGSINIEDAELLIAGLPHLSSSDFGREERGYHLHPMELRDLLATTLSSCGDATAQDQQLSNFVYSQKDNPGMLFDTLRHCLCLGVIDPTCVIHNEVIWWIGPVHSSSPAFLPVLSLMEDLISNHLLSNTSSGLEANPKLDENAPTCMVSFTRATAILAAKHCFGDKRDRWMADASVMIHGIATSICQLIKQRYRLRTGGESRMRIMAAVLVASLVLRILGSTTEPSLDVAGVADLLRGLKGLGDTYLISLSIVEFVHGGWSYNDTVTSISYEQTHKFQRRIFRGLAALARTSTAFPACRPWLSFVTLEAVFIHHEWLGEVDSLALASNIEEDLAPWAYAVGGTPLTLPGDGNWPTCDKVGRDAIYRWVAASWSAQLKADRKSSVGESGLAAITHEVGPRNDPSIPVKHDLPPSQCWVPAGRRLLERHRQDPQSEDVDEFDLISPGVMRGRLAAKDGISHGEQRRGGTTFSNARRRSF